MNLILFFSKKEGRSLSDTDYGCAELGLALANNLDIDISDFFTLQAKSFIASYSDEFDSRIVRIPLSTVQSLFGTNGVHEIAVILDKTSDNDKVYKYIRYTLKNIIVSVVLGITAALSSSLFTILKVSRKSIIELLQSSYS